MLNAEDVKQSILQSFANAERHSSPYPYFIVRNVVPDELVEPLRSLPFPAPDLGGVSGTREVHNKSRNYFDVEHRSAHPECEMLSAALQDPQVVSTIEDTFGTDLKNTFLRIEYGQDTDGFWLEPHTDIGVKSFTMLLYLSNEEGHEALGTSIYSDGENHVGESPFEPNLAMIFIPSNNTWHGFRERPINGIRKSIIINYVTDDWRAREQLAYPDQPVAAG